MKSVFADAGYWIALLSPPDTLHGKAKTISATLGETRIITSEMVLTEVLNAFSRGGPIIRTTAANLVEHLLGHANVEVIPLTGTLFHEALTLYKSRDDKSWSLTDCASVVIMQQRGLTEALSHDKHFQQAGFTALLRDD